MPPCLCRYQQWWHLSSFRQSPRPIWIPQCVAEYFAHASTVAQVTHLVLAMGHDGKHQNFLYSIYQKCYITVAEFFGCQREGDYSPLLLLSWQVFDWSGISRTVTVDWWGLSHSLCYSCVFWASRWSANTLPGFHAFFTLLFVSPNRSSLPHHVSCLWLNAQTSCPGKGHRGVTWCMESQGSLISHNTVSHHFQQQLGVTEQNWLTEINASLTFSPTVHKSVR